MIFKIKFSSGIQTCIYFLFLLNTSTNASFSSFSKVGLKNSNRKFETCKSWEFQCERGQCISKQFLCNGLPDCSDGSDETYDQCRNISCDERQWQFQCHYGACIDRNYACDGVKQCIDGSDESPQTCNITKNKIIRRRRATDKSCAIPPVSADKTFTFRCDEDQSQSCSPVNGNFPPCTLALVTCAPGYSQENVGEEDDEEGKKGGKEQEENSPQHVCVNKKWQPRIRKCHKICEKLNPVNVDLKCYRKGAQIPCEENTILLSGTKVQPSCKPTHRYIGDSLPSDLEITCNKDGKWDNPLFSCIPVCGRPYANPKLAIAGGVQERYGDSPWHVAIFRMKDKTLICGGTIISPHLIISAAHCFVNARNISEPIDINNFEVVVSKVTNNYSATDNENQKAIKIKDIRFSQTSGYFGLKKYHESDIAIVVLEEKLSISALVLPACMDWIGLKNREYPVEDTPGKVSGWGLTENQTYSEIIRTVNLPYIGHKRCVEILPEEIAPFITFDKFCAGSEHGPGVLQGDSGGGLLFKEHGFYYLRGIVSIKQASSSNIASFTDLSLHVIWISSVMNEVEKETSKSTNSTNQIVPPITIASPHNNNKPQMTTTRPSAPSTPQNHTVDNLPRGTNEQIGGAPWHVSIYNLNHQKTLICGGTIITQHLVITAAHCFPDVSDDTHSSIQNYEVVVSKYTRDYDKIDNSNQKSYKIKDIRHSRRGFYGHITYYADDIAILIVGEKITFSESVSPACVSWNESGLAENALGKINGFRLDESNRYADSLQTIDLPYISREHCLGIINDDFIPYLTFDKFCAGYANESQRILRALDSGSGMLFKLYGGTSYYVRGIVSVKAVKSSVAAITDISDHIEWIKSVRKEVEIEFEKISENNTTENPQTTTTPPTNPVTLPSFGKAAAIAMQNCKKYENYRYTKKWHKPASRSSTADSNGFWLDVMDCVKVDTLINGGALSQPKEYPHMAFIGYGKKFKNVRWNCGGSLISEKFVLSAAKCGKTSEHGPPRWVLLGDLNITSDDDVNSTIYEIIKIHDHPNYKPSSSYHDISLFELNTTVVTNPHIRPACLYTSTSNPVDTRASITGWGLASAGRQYSCFHTSTSNPLGTKRKIIGWGLTNSTQKPSDHLLKATISIFEDGKCISVYNSVNITRLERGYDPNSMVCAGPLTNSNATFKGESGGPLQILTDERNCMWNIIGVTSFGSPFCGGKQDPTVYTKVAFYLEWIQSIVWPN